MAKPRQQLQHRRRQLGFTQESFSEAIGVSMTTYRDWERGVAMPRVGFRPRLARHLQVTLVEVDRWLENDGRAIAPDGFEVPGWLGHFAALEQGARELWSFEPMVVPGLLQTAGYATEVERRGPDLVSEGAVAQKVKMRLTRQEVLDREPDPLVLSVVLDESVLYRVAGDAEVMADQLDRLLLDAQRSTVELRILPLATGDFSAAFGGFTVVISPGATEPYMACVRDRSGPHYLDRRHEVDEHVRLFRYLGTVAMLPGESMDLIRTVIQERYR